ncbi:MAG: hydroxyacid dehydrogenase [Candidatus Aenigmarchaeota archaeon]|nr:hydroxyacid dehydrogenase [Candidatus Aenigmarchaeota archaeon]
MAKIAFFEVRPWEEEYLSGKLKGHTLQFFSEPVSGKNLEKAEDSEIIAAFISSKVTPEVLKALPDLKLVSTMSTGFDHIDLSACSARGIKVCNVPCYGENTVAEHTFALILSLSRNVHKSYVRTLKDDFSIDGLVGFDLKGKTIGIIGGGHIGLHVARMARAFGMHVRVYDVNRNEFLAEVINFKYSPLGELLAESDIVSLHVPYNKNTHHLINRENIAKMKKGAVLINTARGAVVDTDALYEALKSGKISGAGLDVIEGEDLIKEEHALLHESGNPGKWREIVRDQKIFRMDNVVFTPHNAFNSREALIRILDTTVENIEGFLKGGKANFVG